MRMSAVTHRAAHAARCSASSRSNPAASAPSSARSARSLDGGRSGSATQAARRSTEAPCRAQPSSLARRRYHAATPGLDPRDRACLREAPRGRAGVGQSEDRPAGRRTSSPSARSAAIPGRASDANLSDPRRALPWCRSSASTPVRRSSVRRSSRPSRSERPERSHIGAYGQGRAGTARDVHAADQHTRARGGVVVDGRPRRPEPPVSEAQQDSCARSRSRSTPWTDTVQAGSGSIIGRRPSRRRSSWSSSSAQNADGPPRSGMTPCGDALPAPVRRTRTSRPPPPERS